MEQLAKILVTRYLNQLGIYTISSGHNEMRESILAALKQRQHIKGKIKISEVYITAGIVLGKSGEAVEKCIRYSIQKCEEEGRIIRLNDICNCLAYVKTIGLTNSQFISLLVTQIEYDLYQLEGKQVIL